MSYMPRKIYKPFIKEEEKTIMLVLPIKKKWFDMICSGKKKEEYRQMNHYYMSRFMNAFGFVMVGDKMLYGNDVPEEIRVEWPVPIILRNGYSLKSPQIKCMCNLRIGHGNGEWGAEPGIVYYILEIKNISHIL